VSPRDAQGRFFRSRLGRILAFVGIVWSIAGTFVVFELATLAVMDLLLSRPALIGGLALSRATRTSRTCAVDPGERPGGTAHARSTADVRARAWLMGLKMGRDALARQHASVDRRLLDQVQAEVHALATGLGVPPPPVFVPRHLANANTEFIAHVETDPGGAARRLAVVHAPDACLHYKLGALWGYAELVRPSLPAQRAIFAAEIRHYAQQTELPSALWEPFLETTPRDAASQDVARTTQALTQRVTQHLAREP
jgi:hypothetical protein